jgi:L-iditol 2-dehydrogenase
VPLPDGLSAEAGALLEPLTVALHAVRNLGLAWGETVAVFGLGAIGNFIAQWARLFGASRLFCIDPAQAKVAIARSVGLADAFSPADPAAELRVRTGGAGVDVAFDASGSAAAINAAIAGLSPFGRMGFLGRPGSGVTLAPESFERILRGQLTLRGTWSFEMASFPHDPWEEAAGALARGDVVTDPLITHRVPLEGLADAIGMMAAGTEPFHKVIVLP